MTGAQKLQFLRDQAERVKTGKQDFFECPYCKMKTYRGDTFCCETMAQALSAIAHRKITNELMDHAKRISDAENN